MQKALLLCLGLTSCAGLAERMAASMGYTHVNLKTPPPESSEQERLEAYKKMRLDKVSSTESSGYVQSMIILNDGTKIYYPQDLLAVVPEGSSTARSIELSEEEKVLASKGGGRTALIVVGGDLLVAPASAVGAFFLFDDNKNKPAIALSIVGGIGFVAPFVLAFRQMRYAQKQYKKSDEALRDAAGSYNEDLLQKLNLCAREDKTIHDCAQGTAGAP